MGDAARLTSLGILIWRQANNTALFTDGLSVWSDTPPPAGPYPLPDALASIQHAGTSGAPVAGRAAPQSAELRVDSTADAPDAAPGDGACSTTAGQCTVRAAIIEANATPGLQRVILDAEVYKLAIEGPGEDGAVDRRP